MRILFAIAALMLAGPALAQTAAPMTPAQAIAAAKASATGEAEGAFEFVVGSTGGSGFNAYLNSETDYRSPANLSVELHTAAQNALLARLGARAEDVLKGKRIRVKGVARRVPIKNREGAVSYYQTRIDVDAADQIEIVG